MVVGGWLEFGSLLQEPPLYKGPVTGHIVMVKNPVVSIYLLNGISNASELG
jgi:hypothetical protein